MSNLNFSHLDPAVEEMQKALMLAHSTGVSQEVTDAIVNALNLVELRENFALTATSPESEACANIARETQSHDWTSVHQQGKTTWRFTPDMMSGRMEGQFLKTLVSIQGARRVLDIGMFTGYSALSMAEALPADGELVSIDMDDYLKTLAGSLFRKSPHHKKIRIVIGDSLNIMNKMAEDGEQFDIIFVDAEKSAYIKYLKMSLEESLLKPGGTIVVDNAFQWGNGYMPSKGTSSAKLFVDAVVADKSLHSVLVPMRDGVMIIRRKCDVEGAVN